MEFEKITSVKNVGINEALALRERKARDAAGLTIIDGIREVEAALQAGIVIQKIYMCPELMERKQVSALLTKISKLKIQILETSRPVFEKIAFGERLEGMIALARQPHRSLDDLALGPNPLLIVVEGVEKPGNLGAILRTCDAAGVDGLVVCDGRTDVYNPNVIRASLGAVFSVKTLQSSNEALLSFLKKNNISICAASPQAALPYTKVDFKKPTAVIVGSEHEGLNPFWLRHADGAMKIPMFGKVDSLNLSATAAVVIYEVLRQRNGS